MEWLYVIYLVRSPLLILWFSSKRGVPVKSPHASIWYLPWLISSEIGALQRLWTQSSRLPLIGKILRVQAKVGNRLKSSFSGIVAQGAVLEVRGQCQVDGRMQRLWLQSLSDLERGRSGFYFPPGSLSVAGRPMLLFSSVTRTDEPFGHLLSLVSRHRHWFCWLRGHRRLGVRNLSLRIVEWFTFIQCLGFSKLFAFRPHY